MVQLISVMRIINNSMFRRLTILLAFVSALVSYRGASDPYMTSRMGTTEYYRWDIKSLDTVSIYNFRILDEGTFKIEEGIDTTGMAALKISGSGQYSVGQFRRLVDTLKHYAGDRKLYFIDLREESHCFANYYPVSWFLAQNVANKGLSLKDVEKDERTRFPKMKGKQLAIYNKVSGEKAGVDSIAMTVDKVFFEKDLVEGSGFGYLRIPCTDHQWPDPCDIDAFIDFIKGIDTDSVWMHFHCVAGKGRTGAFMCLYDMMKNPGVSYEDISDRQSALGASSMRVKHRDPAKPDEKADNNERVSRLLYQYVQDNRADGYQVSWTDWLSNHGG